MDSRPEVSTVKDVYCDRHGRWRLVAGGSWWLEEAVLADVFVVEVEWVLSAIQVSTPVEEK